MPQYEGDRDTTEILSALNIAIAALASSSDPAAQTIASYLREHDRRLIPYALSLTQGNEIADETRIAARDRHIRKLHKTTTLSIAELALALTRYRTGTWPHVMSKPNPHSKESPEYLMYQIYSCKTQALSESRIRNILKTKD